MWYRQKQVKYSISMTRANKSTTAQGQCIHSSIAQDCQKGGRQFQTGKTQRVQKDSWTTNIPESSQQLHATMALDLNIPPTADEEDDPFGGWSRTTHHLLEHPPPAGAQPMGDGDGAASFDLNMAVYDPG